MQRNSSRSIIANGNVYDITTMLSKHPGGIDCIINNIGKDCTEHYNMHTTSGKKEWDKYKIVNTKKWYYRIINSLKQ